MRRRPPHADRDSNNRSDEDDPVEVQLLLWSGVFVMRPIQHPQDDGEHYGDNRDNDVPVHAKPPKLECGLVNEAIGRQCEDSGTIISPRE